MWKGSLALLFISLSGFATQPTRISLHPMFWANANLPFVAFDEGGRFGAGIGMNIQYAPVLSVRSGIEEFLGKRLEFFRGWNPDGEAHLTVITPLEYADVLKPYVSIQEIARVARSRRIQLSDLQVQGVGSGRAILDGRIEETYFLIVESQNVRRFRRAVHRIFVARGGNPSAWDPDRFFPHITIGFTKRDLHESDGILKDARHSFDRRFRLVRDKQN